MIILNDLDNTITVGEFIKKIMEHKHYVRRTNDKK